MPDLNFQVAGAAADPYAATPLLNLKLRVGNRDAEQTIESIALRCQLRIEATRRRYNDAEQEALVDLFGEPDRWSRTVGSLLWCHASATVQSFQDQAEVELPVPCTFDFAVASTKYFHGLEDGEIPLSLHFSGTIFYRDEVGDLQISQIPWDKEVAYRLSVATWRQMIEQHYPNSAWLRLRQDVFDRLHRYKASRGIPDWESTLESLLVASEQQVAP